MIVDLFNAPPADLATVLSPSKFAALDAPLQSELIQLLADRSYSFKAVEAATGLSRDAIVRLGRQHHKVRAFEFERTANEMPAIRTGPRLSVDANRMLGYLAGHGGEFEEAIGKVEADAGIPQGRGPVALRQLIGWGFVITVRSGNGRIPAHYRLTTEGEALLSGQDEVPADA